MTAYTSKSNLPYVQPPDPVTNYPPVSQDLATKLDPYNFDTGWIALTPSIGSGTYGYRVIGKVCYLRADLTGVNVAAGSSGTPTTSGTFPTAYRPSVTAYAMGNGAGAAPLQWNATPAGQVSFWNNHTATVTTARCLFSWPIA